MAFVCTECGRAYPAAGFCTEDGGALADNTHWPLVGQILGSHRIARLIGQGGMGEVYLGVHPEIGSRVAIKLLAVDAARSRSSVERFFAEARAVNVIRHEGIVSITDLARLPDGRPYIVMEYLDGAPLSRVLEEHHPVPLGAFVQIMLWVLGALGAAHAQGITHRDLKPDNVFVTSLGRVKVLDFGIAKLRPELGGVSDATRTGALLGTPFYMSPEQARGEPVDHRSDLYSAGVLLYEGVTGRRPFSADSLYELLRQQIEAAATPPRALRPDLPAALESIILRALEKDPARRFQSAEELAHALQQVTPFLPKESFVTLAGRPSPHAPMLSATPGPSTTSSAGYAATVPEPRPTATATESSSRRSSPLLWLAGGALVSALVVGALAVVAFVVLGDRDTITIVETSGTNPDPTPESDDPELQGPGAGAPKPGVADLRRVDLVAFLPKAKELARAQMADAELSTITINSPRADGILDFGGEDSETSLVYAFKSAKASSGPMGACVVWVTLSGGAPDVSVPPMASCLSGTVRPPRCPLSKVLKQAGVPAKGATVTYGPGPTWTVIDENGELPRFVPDSC